MGRKKFHLVVKKKEERKKYATLTSLIVSVPTAKLHLGTMVSQLPHTWIVQAEVAASPKETSTKIVVCCLETSSGNPVVKYSITLREDFSWLVSAFGYGVTPQSCHLLASTPLILESAYKITQLISLIDHGTICEGNSDSKFLEVAKRRDGIFKNHSGKTNVTLMANYSI